MLRVLGPLVVAFVLGFGLAWWLNSAGPDFSPGMADHWRYRAEVAEQELNQWRSGELRLSRR